MKASKILAGLSALSIAASMLSMVAAAEDEVAGTAPTSTDDNASYNIAGEDPDPVGGDVAEEEAATTGTADDAEYKFGGKTYSNWNFGAKNWAGTKAYRSFVPTSTKSWFSGWPGWGVQSFPTYWELYEDYLAYKDSAWEVWGTKQDNTIPGYIVFEFEGGKKSVIPASVDSNGQVTTKEIPVFRTNVNRIYFLYEVSDAPAFEIKLDKFTVNGKEVHIEKDQLKADKYDANGNPYVDAPTAVDPNGDVVEDIPTYYMATIFAADSLNPNDFDDNWKLENGDPSDESAIDHRLFLFGTKVQITFTVGGIGVNKEPVHVGQSKTGGDQKGETHTHVDPELAGGQYPSDKQVKNLDAAPINPHFTEYKDANGRTYCSKDLYDALVEVYNSDPDHKTDAEIKFKTVSDKNGTLVANFLNVWELDTDKDGNAAHWLKEFRKVYEVTYADGTKIKAVEGSFDETDPTITSIKRVGTEPVYAKKGWDTKVKVRKTETKYHSVTYYQGVQAKDVNGNLLWEDDDKTIPQFETVSKTDNRYRVVSKTVEGSKDINDWGLDPLEETAVSLKDENNNDILAVNMKPHQVHYLKKSYEYKVDAQPDEKEVWINEKTGFVLDENGKDSEYRVGDLLPEDFKFLKDEKVEEAYCWHPYFVTENGLVDIVTKNYLGNYKTNVPEYTWLTDAQIKHLSDNNGMYYNDNIHSAAYGHFVVFGDNTLREYSYRIKADAVKAMLEIVQRSNVKRDDFVMRHGADDIEGFNQDTESMDPQYLDYQARYDNPYDTPAPDSKSWFEHHRAVHGAIWLQVCNGNYITDVSVHAHTDILKHDDLPKLYGKENYEAMYPTVSSSSSAAAAAAAAQPTAAESQADPNAESGAAAGFGIAGLLLAGAAMVCAKKKS